MALIFRVPYSIVRMRQDVIQHLHDLSLPADCLLAEVSHQALVRDRLTGALRCRGRAFNFTPMD